MDWLAEYEAFHKANRGRPGAKYLVHSVDSGLNGGVGDRLRGMLFTVRAAAASKRVLLMRWATPHPLHHFLEPADGGIDWRMDGIELPAPAVEVSAIDVPVGIPENGPLLTLEAPFVLVHVRGWGGVSWCALGVVAGVFTSKQTLGHISV